MRCVDDQIAAHEAIPHHEPIPRQDEIQHSQSMDVQMPQQPITIATQRSITIHVPSLKEQHQCMDVQVSLQPTTIAMQHTMMEAVYLSIKSMDVQTH